MTMPHIFRRGHTVECQGFVPEQSISGKTWNCTCHRPYLAEPAEDFEWVTSHEPGCDFGEGVKDPVYCCRHCTLTVVPLPDGLLGRVKDGELWKRGGKGAGWESYGWLAITEAAEDSVWRAAWERPCQECGAVHQVTERRAVPSCGIWKPPPDGLVCLRGPGITREGIQDVQECAIHGFTPSEWWDEAGGCPGCLEGFSNEADLRFNPHNLSAPEFVRLEAVDPWLWKKHMGDGITLRKVQYLMDEQGWTHLGAFPSLEAFESGDLSGAGFVDKDHL